MQIENITWRDLIQATLEFLNNKATVDDIYEILSKSKKLKTTIMLGKDQTNFK